MDQESGGFWSKSELKEGVSGVSSVSGGSSDLCFEHKTANHAKQKFLSIHTSYAKTPFGHIQRLCSAITKK
ncbi:MAG: hypothetical protein Q4E41_08540 [Bacteroidales bacterium]|nr:hypothetical protein [Bacteroidales bacterium]